MASTKLAFLAVSVLLLQASRCALSQQLAMMALTSFEQGGDGGGPAECDGRYHSDGDLLAALSTQWYAGGSRCNKKIRITFSIPESTLQTAEATVVDECDSQSGCPDNMVATSQAVWDALKLGDADGGQVKITWVDV